VAGLSSHIEVSPSQAVVTYNWGDFKHDPEQVLADYFDAFLYYANWGTRRLMFRFPAGLLDEAAVAPYLLEEFISLSSVGGEHLLEFTQEDEGGEWYNEEADANGTLSAVAGLRNDILAGDFRCLYLAWLGATALEDPDDSADLEEPPVPAGLGQLTPALQRFADFFRVDDALIESAATASPARAPGLSEAALRQALAQLTRDECELYLLRLAQADPSVGLALRHQLSGLVPPAAAPVAAQPRTLAEISASVEQRRRAAAERVAAAAEERRIADLKQLAQREDQVWREIETLLQRTAGSAYEQAANHLVQLRDLADYQEKRPEFNWHLTQLRENYKSRPAFIKRLSQKGLA
jgi:hypothetical protein